MRGLRSDHRHEILQAPPYEHEKGNGDVVLLVRQWMASTELSQRPKLVLPECLRNLSTKFISDITSCTKGMYEQADDARLDQLCKLADFLTKDYTMYGRGADYLRKAALPNTGAPNALEFLEMGFRFDFAPQDFDEPLNDVFVPRELNVYHPRRRNILDLD